MRVGETKKEIRQEIWREMQQDIRIDTKRKR
jgi:hypothetical protein